MRRCRRRPISTVAATPSRTAARRRPCRRHPGIRTATTSNTRKSASRNSKRTSSDWRQKREPYAWSLRRRQGSSQPDPAPMSAAAIWRTARWPWRASKARSPRNSMTTTSVRARSSSAPARGIPLRTIYRGVAEQGRARRHAQLPRSGQGQALRQPGDDRDASRVTAASRY
jgi:hypothetical protein